MRTPEAVRRLASRQDDVVTTADLRRLGLDEPWVRRRVDAGLWQRVHRGVFVPHPQPPSWRTRARAALAHAGPGAVLSHASAGHLHELVAKPPWVIDVSVPAARQVPPTRGVRYRRRRTMPAVVASGGLVHVDLPDTVLDLLAETRSVDTAIGTLCDAVRTGVHPAAVRAAMADRPWLPGRGLLTELLGEVDVGIESPLESRYLRDVERAHGLPGGARQERQVVGGLWIRADCIYEEYGVRVELDGALAHAGGATAADVWRDNAVLLARSQLTLRYRWLHVGATPCATAHQVALALRSGGWRGVPRLCSPTCGVRRG